MIRLVTWNCRIGGFRRKAARIGLLRPLPDVLAIQEVEPISAAMFPNDFRPTYVDRSCAIGFPRRGFGMLSYSDAAICALDASEPFSGFRRYEVRKNGLCFNAAGVWPWATSSTSTSYRQAHAGLLRHASWIRERPTVVLGDFNASARYHGSNWKDLIEFLSGFGLVSAYHRFKEQQYGLEADPTHFHDGERSASFHLDYCFIPETWVSQISDVSVGSFDDWHDISDHVPLIVDLRL